MKNQVDAAATVEGLTRESFSHLDEKKILRKVGLQRLSHYQLLTLPDGPSSDSHASPPLPPFFPRP
jgi:hypothetical protein